MRNERLNARGEIAEGAEPEIRVEKRGSPRKPTTATFTVHIDSTSLFGAGRNISRGGAYLVTSDPISVEVSWRDRGGERVARGRLVRIERLTSESLGVALQFDREQDL
ncbi:MAG: PilZ domain-containing protein [Planctomycetota bacterium]